MGISIVLTFFYFALMKDKLLVSLDFYQLPVCSSFSETEEGSSHVHVAADQVKLDETLGASVYFFALHVHLAYKTSMGYDWFCDSFVPTVEEFSNCSFYSSHLNFASSGDVKNVKEEFLTD